MPDPAFKNESCAMCDGTGEGSGGWKGMCGYCDGTGEGTCRECRYPASSPTPSASCMNHGVTEEGHERRRELARARLDADLNTVRGILPNLNPRQREQVAADLKALGA